MTPPPAVPQAPPSPPTPCKDAGTQPPRASDPPTYAVETFHAEEAVKTIENSADYADLYTDGAEGDAWFNFWNGDAVEALDKRHRAESETIAHLGKVANEHGLAPLPESWRIQAESILDKLSAHQANDESGRYHASDWYGRGDALKATVGQHAREISRLELALRPFRPDAVATGATDQFVNDANAAGIALLDDAAIIQKAPKGSPEALAAWNRIDTVHAPARKDLSEKINTQRSVIEQRVAALDGRPEIEQYRVQDTAIKKLLGANEYWKTQSPSPFQRAGEVLIAIQPLRK
jgi:hypothetical protein